MAESGETAKHRSWWPWVVLGALVLFFVSAIAWQFRPLNANERRLVGTWERLTTSGLLIRFGDDRRWMMNHVSTATLDGIPTVVVGEFDQGGVWSAGSDGLHLRIDTNSAKKPVLERLLSHAVRLLNPPPGLPLRFEGRDRMWLEERENFRVGD